MKWKLICITVMLILFSTVVFGAEICEDKLTPGQECTMLTPSVSYCGNYTYAILNSSGTVVANTSLTNVGGSIYSFTFNLTEGSYIVQLCDGSARELIVEGDDQMSSIAITIFVLLVAGVFFALPFLVRRFSDNPFVDVIIARSCWIIATYLMVLNSAIMATIADYAGLPLTNEMFRYLWLFSFGGYAFMIFVFFKLILDIIRMYQAKGNAKRMGGREW